MSDGLDDLQALDTLDRENFLKLAKGLLANGVALSFWGTHSTGNRQAGAATADAAGAHVGSPADQSRNS